MIDSSFVFWTLILNNTSWRPRLLCDFCISNLVLVQLSCLKNDVLAFE